ncbi:LysR family transcriptional regulator [Microvirga pudoricolor]|uniref:LysR family transcriptional regulator n=1 Tax=Microvirga pudoricolor TaxID=2778729 RepID=UPI002D2189B8|nr:LysR family transcriptional regulator [Microvirga pudoricolor]MBM6593560.1 LysR family transcriptional regulator [Microvirga pudoricolor]
MTPDISMRDLESFDALARFHSYTNASEELGMTQSALSKRIKELEEKLGVRLFDRTTRQVSMTSEGQEFLSHATKLLEQFRRSVEEVRERAAGFRGRLSIAAAPHMSANLLPPVIASFLAEHPEVEIEFHDCRSHETLRHILSEEADIGLTVTPSGYVAHPQIAILPVLDRMESLTVVFRRNHPLETLEQVTWQTLRPHRMVVLRPTSAAVRLVDVIRTQQNIAFEHTFEVSLIDTALGMAAAGVGVAVFPRYVTSRSGGNSLVYREIQNSSMRISFGLQYLRGRTLSGPAKNFARHLRTYLAAMEPEGESDQDGPPDPQGSGGRPPPP